MQSNNDKPNDSPATSNIHGEGNAQISIGTLQTANVINNYFMDQEQAQTLQYTQAELEQQSLKQLSNYYKKFCTLKGVLEADRPYPLDAIFVQLLLITDKVQKQTEAMLGFEHHSNLFDENSHLPKAIDLQNIFEDDGYKNCKPDSAQIKSPRTLLIVGCAGVGKTTLCNYIAYQWAENKRLFNNRFQGIIWIPLRQLNKNRYPEVRSYDLSEVLVKESNGWLHLAQAKALMRAIQDTPEKFLFLLDGYDELLPEAAQGYLTTVFEQLSSMPYCIITSRPRSMHTLRFDYRMEIMGFSDENIQKFTQGFFKLAEPHAQKYAESFEIYLKTTPTVAGIMQIPILLTMACELHARGELLGDKNTDSPKTMTDLYMRLVDELFKKFVIKAKGKNPELCTPKVVQAVSKPVRQVLENLALEGLLKKKIIFTAEDLDLAIENAMQSQDVELNEKIIDEMIQNGLLRKTLQSGPDYYFIHLTFQEYFAACVVADKLNRYAQLNENEKISLHRLFAEHKYNPRFQMVWPFVSGLLSKKPEALQKFFELLKKLSPDILRFHEMNLLLRCLESAKAPDTLPDKKIILSQIVEEIKKYLDDDLKNSLNYRSLSADYHRSLEKSPICVRDAFFVQEAVAKLLDENVKQKKSGIIHFLNQINPEEPIFLEKFVKIAISDGDLNAIAIIENVCNKEGKIPSAILQELLKAIKNQDRKIIDNVMDILLKLVRFLIDQREITGDLINLAKNKVENLKVYAVLEKILSLGYRKNQDDIKMFVENLTVSALNTPGFHQSDAYSLLIKFYKIDNPHAMTEVIFSVLENSLLQGNNDIRYRAAQMCQSIVFYAKNTHFPRQDMMSNLVKVLVGLLESDPDEEVKYAVASAIGSFESFAATIDGVIAALTKATSHRHIYIRNNAAQALKSVNYKEITIDTQSKVPEPQNNNNLINKAQQEAKHQSLLPLRQSSAPVRKNYDHKAHAIHEMMSVRELVDLVINNSDRLAKSYALDTLLEPSTKSITQEQLLALSKSLLTQQDYHYRDAILKILNYHFETLAIPQTLNILLCQMDLNLRYDINEQKENHFFHIGDLKKTGILDETPDLDEKIDCLLCYKELAKPHFIAQTIKCLLRIIYIKSFRNPCFKDQDEKHVRSIDAILRSPIESTINFTINDVTLFVLSILDDALQKPGPQAYQALRVIGSIRKEIKVDVFDASWGYCLYCGLYQNNKNTYIEALLDKLSSAATTETLFELFANETAPDKHKKFYKNILYKRFSALSSALYIDFKDSTLCIWEKGVIKRSKSLSKFALDQAIKDLCEFFNIDKIDAISIHESTSSTAHPINETYSLVEDSSSNTAVNLYQPEKKNFNSFI